MVVRTLEKVIAHPIIRVRVVKKYILVADGGEARRSAIKGIHDSKLVLLSLCGAVCKQ
jgi:hypothetical protein